MLKALLLLLLHMVINYEAPAWMRNLVAGNERCIFQVLILKYVGAITEEVVCQ